MIVRAMSARQHLTPNAIIAGVSKCGTTSLFRYLASHPDVCASTIKEINFFTRVPQAADLSAYAQYFERCPDRPSLVLLEASPIYLHFASLVAPVMKAALPDVRLIFVLRDPVSRFLSHYRYLQLKAGVISGRAGPDAFIRHLTASDGSLSDERLSGEEETLQECVRASLYADNLQRFLDLFGPSRVFIGYLEQLERAPAAFMQALCAFLAIPGEMYEGYGFSVENRRRNTKRPTVNHVAEVLTLGLEPVFNRYPALRKGVRRVYFRLNPEIGETEAHGLTSETDAVLRRHYAPSVHGLRRIIEHWYPDATLPEWVAAYPAPK
jgi:hypothetical protein